MKKLLCSLVAAVMVMSMLAMSAYAGNTTDSTYNVDERIGYVHPLPREKQNATSVYVYPMSGSLSTWKVDVLGLMGSPDTWLGVPKCNDGLGTRTISVGSRYFLYNDVYESHYTHASLEFEGNGGSTVSIKWSPDSVWESGVISKSLPPAGYQVI